MLDFNGRTVLITGAGRGIGRQHSLMLAQRGANIVVNDYGGGLRGENGNNPSPAASVISEIHAQGGNAQAACYDIGDKSQVEKMFAEIISHFGRIDVVIHNASVYAPLGPFPGALNDDLERILRVNITGGWNVSQAAWPHMEKQGYGRIVHTGSGAGFFGRRNDQAYSAAKAGLMGLTKVLAAEGVKVGIKVNMIGPVAWTENAGAQGAPPFMEQLAPTSAISNVVALLAHESCPVNGEIFHAGAGFVSRVFVAETEGVVMDTDTMSPETVADNFDRIMDETGYRVPKDSNKSHVFEAVVAANPLAKQLIEEARTQAAARRRKG